MDINLAVLGVWLQLKKKIPKLKKILKNPFFLLIDFPYVSVFASSSTMSG